MNEYDLESPKSRIEVLLQKLLSDKGSLISIKVQLSKNSYEKNESINFDDAIITARFDSGKILNISPKLINWSPLNNTILDTPGTKEIIASYTLKNITKTWRGKITILYPINRIQVTKKPDKIIYEDGESIDFTGIEVTAYREDNSVWGVIPFEELEFPVTIASKE